MVSKQEIIKALETLSEYYDSTLSKPNVRIYVNLLLDIPTYSLQHAIYHWINTSPFFPKVSDLRTTAEEYPVPKPDHLEIEFESLKQRFYTDRTLDLEAWHLLERKLTAQDRLEEAAHLRHALHHFQTAYDENGSLTDEVKNNYLQWENP